LLGIGVALVVTGWATKSNIFGIL